MTVCTSNVVKVEKEIEDKRLISENIQQSTAEESLNINKCETEKVLLLNARERAFALLHAAEERKAEHERTKSEAESSAMNAFREKAEAEQEILSF